MSADNDAMAPLPDTAARAVRRFRASIGDHALTVSEKGAVLIVLDRCADELDRLVRENDALSNRVHGVSNELECQRSRSDHAVLRAERAEAELARRNA